MSRPESATTLDNPLVLRPGETAQPASQELRQPQEGDALLQINLFEELMEDAGGRPSEPMPLTMPGELNAELTGPLDPAWLAPTPRRAIDEFERTPPPGFSLRAWDEDTQRLGQAPATQWPAVSTTRLLQGSQIGRYRLDERLGEGGLGTVWSAYDTVLARQVALKTLTLTVPADEREQVTERVLDEARAAARLSHPHIVTVHDAGVSDQGAYIAMELLRGKDLAELLRSGWQPSPEQAALIVRRVADALSYAHSKGVIHRDIKPANIFMVGRTRPVVLDFGIARLLHRADDPAPAVGSPYYAAPEQYDGKECDPRSDVYSLGVVLYELLCGERPFTGASLGEIRSAVRSTQPASPRERRPTVPLPLADMALRALSRDPNQRPRSAGALARELRAWLADSTGGTSVPVDRPSERSAPVAAVARPVTGPLSPGPAAPHPRSPASPLRLEPITLLEGPQDTLPPRRSPLRLALRVATGAAAAVLAWWLFRSGGST
jgi:serine/threonine-protein kinase